MIMNPYRDIAERIGDYEEVEKAFDRAVLATESERCMNCGIPFCHGAGCPLGNVIPEMNAAFRAGKMRQAWEVLSMTSFFPEFTSRVCPALCEGACTHGIDTDPVSVRKIEKCVIETAFTEGYVKPVIPQSRNGKKIAIVGAGPAGLFAAEYLNRRGFSVTVYDANSKPGGLLRCGIPDFKLNKRVIDRRISVMEQEGIRFVCNTMIGRDIASGYLLGNHDALLLAIGTPSARDLPVPGRGLNGIYFALDFLRGQNRVISGEADRTPISAEGKRVVIIGGGDTGSDCAGTAIRQHAESVLQIEIMPMPPEHRSPSTPWPQWPYQLRISSSHQEGALRRWNLATDSFAGADGQAAGVKVHSVDWEFSQMGKPLKFSAKPDSEELIEADLVLLAMGFTGVPEDGIAADLGLVLTPRGGIVPAPERRIFAAGDCASGASLVVRAMADGKKAAQQICGTLKR